MLYNKQELAHMAIDAANDAGIRPALVCAIIDVSSGWNAGLSQWEPDQWLLGTHPQDLPGKEEEYIALGTRWGLLQFRGSQARNAGYKGPFTSELGDPQVNLKVGCFILKGLIDQSAGDLKRAVLFWYGFERSKFANLTISLLSSFELFVQNRPTAVSTGKASAD